jgi:orotate phosphoribosyltransferase
VSAQSTVRDRDGRRRAALEQLKSHDILMTDGHFDYGNGYHGRVYLNPHRIFRQPSLIWRLSQELIDLLPPDVVETAEVVAGPTLGGAILAHTIAGLLDGRRELSRPATSFAPLSVDAEGHLSLRPFYRTVVTGRRVLLVDDVRNTGRTFERAHAAISAAGGQVIATAEICDRLEALVELDVPNFALAEYPAPDNHAAEACPMCRAGTPVATF